jgi:phenylalanyl-tRNA synthetase beta chain
MKFSYSLLKKIYPDIIPLKKIAAVLPLHLFEVESVDGDTIDIKVLPNRYSDASSHMGIAREISAITGIPFSFSVSSYRLPRERGLLSVSVRDRKQCFSYRACLFEIDAHPATTSPIWMQQILRSCGIHPISALVDITNYTMLVTGQPLHVFDADVLSRDSRGRTQIIVRPASSGELFTTLDNREIPLDPSMLVIADSRGPLALAGIKGGIRSGVTASTTRFILEAASFDGVGIFKTARRAEIITDASIRFSHGLSSDLVDQGFNFACTLFQALGARVVDTASVSPRTAPRATEIVFDPAEYTRFIGAHISTREVSALFTRLGFSVRPLSPRRGTSFSSGSLRVTIPPIRQDIFHAHDLYEEVVRLSGIDQLPSVAPTIALKNPVVDPIVSTTSLMRSVLVRLGFDELYTSSFVDESSRLVFPPSSSLLYGRGKLVSVANPISSGKRYLRTNLSHGLSTAAVANNRFFSSQRIFEVGHVFVQDDSSAYDEAVSFAFLLSSGDTVLLREAKGVLRHVLESLGIGEHTIVVPDDFQHIAFIRVGTEDVGFLERRILEPSVYAVVCELNLTALLAHTEQERAFLPPARFPSIIRDISLIVPRDCRIGEIADALWAAGKESFLVDVDLIDEYYDPTSFSQKQSLTFRLVFLSEDRSLTDDEVNVSLDRITSLLSTRFSAEIR